MNLDLAGTWAFQVDPGDSGVGERWYARTLGHQIQLPGSLQAQGYGEDPSVTTEWTGDIFDRSWFTDPKYAPYRVPGNVKVPFWLQPKKQYRGVAWYQRDVNIPPEWHGGRIALHLERTHWETRVWLDEREVGFNNSLSTPHVYDLGTEISTGRHRITIRVDNSLIVNVGPNAHSVSDHTQTNWNGIIGCMDLRAGSPVWIENVQIFPDVTRKSLTAKVRVGNVLPHSGHGQVIVQAQLRNVPRKHEPQVVTRDIDIACEGAIAEVEYPLGDDAQLWDEFNPALYDLTVRLDADVSNERFSDEYSAMFGLREVGVAGTHITINDRPIFLRGTLECCVFPLTGYPPTDVESWKRIIHVCKAHGLNHIRFHSWCPPEAAFTAADERGFYYQIECAAWANQGASIGEGQPLDTWLYQEGHRIIAAYGNHPSFIMMAYGNEPAGEIEEYLSQWVNYWKQYDGRRLYTSGAGWPAIPENDYHNVPEPRIQAWGQELNSRINALPPETYTDYSEYVGRLGKPIVSHEIGQWCAFPNFDEIDKYTGFLRPRNFEIFRDLLTANHMGDQARDFLLASGKLQALCYKEEIESALRTPGFSGFQLLGLNDFPGQGTALVGVVDAFWESKGYIRPDEFRRFCNSTVLLARMAKRYWTSSETFNAEIDIAHFGSSKLDHATVVWKLVDASGVVVTSGHLPSTTILTGSITKVGSIQVTLGAFTPVRKYTLIVGLENVPYENDWDIWVFADQLETSVPENILVAESLDARALDYLSDGGTVLLMPLADHVNTSSQIGFSSVFWNTAWTSGQAPHTLGIWCDPAHPVFSMFPTKSHSNWQWWELIHGSAAMVLDGWPTQIRPLVQPIDTWFESRRLALLVEAKVGGGKLMICSMDLRSNLERRLVARQMRYSLIHYLCSAHFDPSIEVDVETVQAIFK